MSGKCFVVTNLVVLLRMHLRENHWFLYFCIQKTVLTLSVAVVGPNRFCGIKIHLQITRFVQFQLLSFIKHVLFRYFLQFATYRPKIGELLCNFCFGPFFAWKWSKIAENWVLISGVAPKYLSGICFSRLSIWKGLQRMTFYPFGIHKIQRRRPSTKRNLSILTRLVFADSVVELPLGISISNLNRKII